jgi:ADP-heptose:LPS heptosyltransferase
VRIAGGTRVAPDFALALGAQWRDAAATALPPGPVYVGLAPGAGGAQKRWPRERFVALAQAQAERGRRLAFVLGPDEADWREALQAALPRVLFPLQDARIDAALAASPLYTMAVGRRLAAAVANDSGAGHLLAASGCPLVSLFGPSPAAKFAPAARRLVLVEAQRFGGNEMTDIPLAAVNDALEQALADAATACDTPAASLSAPQGRRGPA